MNAAALLVMALIGFVGGYIYSSMRTQHDADAMLRGSMPRHPSLQRVYIALFTERGES